MKAIHTRKIGQINISQGWPKKQLLVRMLQFSIAEYQPTF
jgi:hypothetical protein